MNIAQITRHLEEYGNCVVAVKDVENKRTGIKEFIDTYGITIAKMLPAESDYTNDVYILEADKYWFSQEVVDEINLNYLRNYAHRYVCPKNPMSYHRRILETKKIWELQELAKKEFGVKHTELFSKEVLITIIEEDSEEYYARKIADI